MDALLNALGGGVDTGVDDACAAWGFRVVCEFEGSALRGGGRGDLGGFENAEVDENWDEGNVGGVHYFCYFEVREAMD
jgi:hypothetical protein